MAQRILLEILGPILVMIALGAVMRWKFRVDIGTLSKLNLYLFVPVFIFDKVSTSTMPWATMGGVFLITLTHTIVLGAVVWGIGWFLGVRSGTLAAIALAVMFYNSGNFGLPLAELAYPASADDYRNGGAVQAFVAMAQNILTYTVGLTIAAWAGTGNLKKGATALFRMPAIYTLAAALLVRYFAEGEQGVRLPAIIANTSKYLSMALVPVALVTLGAQLAINPRWPKWRPVLMVTGLRLIYAPLQMMALLWMAHMGWSAVDLWDARRWPAEVMILTAAVPSAVTTLLLTLELGGDAELAADCVFWTTIFSCATITGWLVVLQMMAPVI